MAILQTINAKPATPAPKAEDMLAAMQAQLNALAAQNAQLAASLEAAKAKAKRTVTFKVSPTTGVVCVYGINAVRPVSLYAPQWRTLILEHGERLITWLNDPARKAEGMSEAKGDHAKPE